MAGSTSRHYSRLSTSNKQFKLVSPFKPTGDQPQAIEKIVEYFQRGRRHVVLLGVTGSGKTFTMANVIERLQRPVLVISHNKTLAAQLYQEFRRFFPTNAVEYFVSYYDYYQPEAYIPQTDTYISKEATINEELDKFRLRATQSLFERRDVIVVASVSCIYGMGDPDVYFGMVLTLSSGERKKREEILNELVNIQYLRSEEPVPGRFRVRGDQIEIFPPYEDTGYRIELFGDEIDAIFEIEPLSGRVISQRRKVRIYPVSYFVTPQERLQRAIKSIEEELQKRIKELVSMGKVFEAERLERRTRYDLLLLRETGHCPGIENYSRHLSGRAPGEPPFTLMDYIPDDTLIIIDESHMTIPQLRAMYEGDRSRKLKLVEYGFRLPSALDNRPLKFEEWERRVGQVLYVSATPGPYELEKSRDAVVEQIIRPTGLVDPEVEVRPTKGQIEDFIAEVKKRIEIGDRVLVTTLTKRLAEELTSFLLSVGIKARYLHSDIDTLERVKIIKALRSGEIDVLVGINLLREGLDLPEVSLVVIFDADREGFLRSTTALIQTFGRAARNVRGKVIMYADRITSAMREAMEETSRRRKIQTEYNKKMGITPETVKKEVLYEMSSSDYFEIDKVAEGGEDYITAGDREKMIKELERKMKEAASRMDFELAARYRDKIKRLKQIEVIVG